MDKASDYGKNSFVYVIDLYPEDQTEVTFSENMSLSKWAEKYHIIVNISCLSEKSCKGLVTFFVHRFWIILFQIFFQISIP